MNPKEPPDRPGKRRRTATGHRQPSPLFSAQFGTGN